MLGLRNGRDGRRHACWSTVANTARHVGDGHLHAVQLLLIGCSHLYHCSHNAFGFISLVLHLSIEHNGVGVKYIVGYV